MTPEFLVPGKRPYDVVDLECDWTNWLTGGRTLDTVTWVAPEGLTIVASTLQSPSAFARVSGGLLGVRYGVLCRADFSDGLKLEAILVLPILTVAPTTTAP